jgi:hypothetical protein
MYFSTGQIIRNLNIRRTPFLETAARNVTLPDLVCQATSRGEVRTSTMKEERLSETVEIHSTLTRLIARKYFFAFSRRESVKSNSLHVVQDPAALFKPSLYFATSSM